MDALNLSQIYALATHRIAEAATELYEELHDYKGRPVEHKQHIDSVIKKFRMSASIELDMIQQALIDYNEGEQFPKRQ